MYDTFSANVLERKGKIERIPFRFIADNCKVWHKGRCIVNIDSVFTLVAEINPDNQKIDVHIDNHGIESYIDGQTCFAEISRTYDRIYWSNDLLNSGTGFQYRDMSLFYFNGILSRVSINRNNPLILIEFYSKKQGEIADVPNALHVALEPIRNADDCIGQKVDFSNVSFISDSHQRYEDGVPVRGLQSGCVRAIEIKKNVNGCKGYDLRKGDGYLVTIFNSSGINPRWGDNIQLLPKPMRIVSQTDSQTVFMGYKCAAMSPIGWVNFAGDDYGLTVLHKNGIIYRCILHFYDRNVDIEYYCVDKSTEELLSVVRNIYQRPNNNITRGMDAERERINGVEDYISTTKAKLKEISKEKGMPSSEVAANHDVVFPFGIEKEADIYSNSTKFALSQLANKIEPQIDSLVKFMIIKDVDTLSLTTIVRYMVQWTKGAVRHSGWKLSDEDGVAWWIGLMVKAYMRITNNAHTFEEVFRPVFIAYFNE